ncbi:MAG: DNA primase [Rhodospirillaceae bacterium]|nr:DNA primase [Rhodospirillaceae bacterium]
MAFPPQFLDEIRTRVSVSSVVGRRARLIKRGREYVCLSPFTNEKTPSFTINDDKGFYHCFSSGEHGDIFKFVMKMQNLSFPEAVERLAEEAGLEVPKQSADEIQQAEQGARGREAVEAACKLYEEVLHAPEGRRGLEYLQNRGLTDETIKRFRLGYAPGGNVIKTKFLARGVKEDVLLETRLLSPGKDGRESFDFFRDRVMFPIFDLRGRPVAFGGRVMGEGEPKYLNSPDTPLFHKGQLLYGMALAREAAASKREIIVAEGYMDVIALAQAGFTNAVAPLGTAMTESQIELLWRMSPEPILCFDGDKAGRGAALRAAERALPLLKPGLSLRFALMPAGKDPDDICRRDGAGAMAQVLAEAAPLSDVLWRQLLLEHQTDTPERRAGLEKAAMAKASQIADGTVQAQYRRLFKDRLFELFRPQSTKGSGYAAWRGGKNQGRGGQKPPSPLPPAPLRRTGRDAGGVQRTREGILLAALINHPGLRDHVEERLGGMSFADSRLDSLRQTALMHLAQNPELDFEALRAHLANLGFAEDLGNLLNSDVYVHAGFARPTASMDQATAGWDHTFALCQRTDLEADFERAKAELEANPSDQTWATFMALKEQVQPDEDEDGNGPDFDDAGHHRR